MNPPLYEEAPRFATHLFYWAEVRWCVPPIPPFYTWLLVPFKLRPKRKGQVGPFRMKKRGMRASLFLSYGLAFQMLFLPASGYLPMTERRKGKGRGSIGKSLGLTGHTTESRMRKVNERKR